MTLRKFALLLGILFLALPLSAARLRNADRGRTAPIAGMSLGDTGSDLVFTPAPICRVFDTRFSTLGTRIGAGETRNFYVVGSTDDFVSQGGTNLGCGIPDGAAAVMINFVAVNPLGAGNLRGSAYPDPIPTVGSIINYQALTPGLNIANGIIFPVCTTGCTFDIKLFANGAATHVIGDVAGYFKRFPTEQVLTNIVAGPGTVGGGSGDVTVSLNFAGTGTAGAAARSDHILFAQTVFVSPGATESDSGTALLDAMAGITDASATKPYLLKIEPGIYDLGTASLVLKPYVDVEGSGESATIIRRRPAATFFDAVIVASVRTQLRFLTAEVTGGGAANATGLFHTGTDSIDIVQCTIKGATGTAANYGVWSRGTTRFQRATIIAEGGTFAEGIENDGIGGPSSLSMANSRVLVSGSTSQAYGIRNVNGASAELQGVEVTVSGSGSIVFAFDNGLAAASIRESTLSASGGNLVVALNTGSDSAGGPHIARVDRSILSTSPATISRTISAFTGHTVLVGATQLKVGVVSSIGGITRCIGSYDENYQNTIGFTACP